MTIDDQVTELRRVAFALNAMSDMLPAGARVGLTLGDGDEDTEVNFHGCTPATMRAVLAQFPNAEPSNDAYGNPRYITVQDDALELTFYLA